jgi:hypothetical protein
VIISAFYRNTQSNASEGAKAISYQPASAVPKRAESADIEADTLDRRVVPVHHTLRIAAQ